MNFVEFIVAANDAVLEHLGGEEVIYAPAMGGPVSVTGIFDENFLLLNPGESMVGTVTPSVWLELSDLPVDPDEDPTLTIRGKDYRVRERVTDGSVGGGVHLFLHEVTA